MHASADRPLAARAPLTPRPRTTPRNPLQVLLYGGDGGFKLKLRSMERTISKVVQIQCLYGSFALVRRVRKRRHTRMLIAAVYIQKLYRRRLVFYLSDKANRLASAAAQHRKDYLAEREARHEAQMRVAAEEQRAERRTTVLATRWVAVRSAVVELKDKTTAAVMLQCRYRTRQARRALRHKKLEKRSMLRELNYEEYAPKAPRRTPWAHQVHHTPPTLTHAVAPLGPTGWGRRRCSSRRDCGPIGRP